MTLDLAAFLAAESDSVLAIDEPVDLVHEMTAIQHALDSRGRHPVLLFRRPRRADGSISPIPVVNNLTASRDIVARALGVADHRQCAASFAARSGAGVAPITVARGDAPVQQLVFDGADADLGSLPVVTQHELEPGPYLTAAHATTVDPASGIDNTAIQRCWVLGPRQMTWFPYPSSHNARNLAAHWRRGEACPVAFWIGHHPAVTIATQAKLDYPQSHWQAAGGLLGAPLRLVPTVTHGERLCVPADAEIVIEGFAHPDQHHDDGPFGEYTGYLGPRTQAILVDVRCITRRRAAVYHDYGSGLSDMLVPDNVAMEGKIFQLVKPVAPALRNVHVPTAGRRFHALLQFDRPGPGEVRDALLAALAYRRVKVAVALDSDVDLFADEQVQWAIATRVQWDRDALVVGGLSTSLLDPSLEEGAQTAAKLGLDATRTLANARRIPVASVPAEALARARAVLAAHGLD